MKILVFLFNFYSLSTCIGFAQKLLEKNENKFVTTQDFLTNYIGESDSVDAVRQIKTLKEKYKEKLNYKLPKNYSIDWPDTCLSGNCVNGEGELLAGYKRIIGRFINGKPNGFGLIVFQDPLLRFAVFEGVLNGWDSPQGKFYVSNSGYYDANKKWQKISKPLIFETEVNIEQNESNIEDYDLRHWDAQLNFIFREEDKKISFQRSYHGLKLYQTAEKHPSLGIVSYDLSRMFHSYISFADEGVYRDIKVLTLGKTTNDLIRDTTNIHVIDTYNNKDEILAKVRIYPAKNKFGYEYKFTEVFGAIKNTVGFYDFFEVPWVERIADSFRLGNITFEEKEGETEIDPSIKTYVGTREVEKYVGIDKYTGREITRTELISENKTDFDIKLYGNYKVDCYCDGKYLFSFKKRRGKTPLLDDLMAEITPVEINGVVFKNNSIAYSFIEKAVFQRGCNYKPIPLIDLNKQRSIMFYNNAKQYYSQSKYEQSILELNKAINLYGGSIEYYQLRADAEEKRGDTTSANINRYLIKKMKNK